MKKAMKLLNKENLMECKVCGNRHLATRITGGSFARGSWKCENGCKLD